MALEGWPFNCVVLTFHAHNFIHSVRCKSVILILPIQDAHFSVSVDTHSMTFAVHAMTTEMKSMLEDVRKQTQYVVRTDFDLIVNSE